MPGLSYQEQTRRVALDVIARLTVHSHYLRITRDKPSTIDDVVVQAIAASKMAYKDGDYFRDDVIRQVVAITRFVTNRLAQEGIE
jgi:hypothetical protein